MAIRTDGAIEEKGDAAEEADLWRCYASHRDAATRRILIERYLGLARRIAASTYAKRFNEAVEFDDCLQFARIGLLEAIDRFDPVHDVQFVTFATYRIRGAVLNGLEHASERAAQHKQRRRALRQERAASLRASAEGRDSFAEMVDVTLALALGYVLEDSGLWKPLNDDPANDPYKSLELKRLGERVGLVVSALPEREQQIVRYHYFEHMDFQAIAEIMEISKGRVSQLHARSLQLLREALQALQRFSTEI